MLLKQFVIRAESILAMCHGPDSIFFSILLFLANPILDPIRLIGLLKIDFFFLLRNIVSVALNVSVALHTLATQHEPTSVCIVPRINKEMRSIKKCINNTISMSKGYGFTFFMTMCLLSLLTYVQ